MGDDGGCIFVRVGSTESTYVRTACCSWRDGHEDHEIGQSQDR